MKPAVLVLACVLSGCAASALPPMPLPPPSPPEPAASAAPAPPGVVASKTVVNHFDKASVRELSVVLAPDATPDQIDRINAADKQARAALTALGKQGHHIDPATLAHARAAVSALENALDE